MALPLREHVRMLSSFFSRRTLFAERFLHATPASFGLEAEEVTFWVAKGAALRGWFIRGTKPGALVFCPGNNGNASSHFPYVRLACATGHSVIAFDYRGFGRSDGQPCLDAIVKDVRAAVEFAAYHAPGEPVGLFGISLGAAAALAAARDGGVAGVAAEGLADLPSMLAGLLRRGCFGPRRIEALGGAEGIEPRDVTTFFAGGMPDLFARWIAQLAVAVYPFAGKRLGRLAKRLTAIPVFAIHGVEDRLLPFETALDFHDALRGPKRLWLIQAVGHAQEPAVACTGEYTSQLARFFGEAFAGRLEPPPAISAAVQRDAPSPGDVGSEDGPWTRLSVSLEAAAAARGPVLLSAEGGGILRQVVLTGPARVDLLFPGPVKDVVTLRLAAHGEAGREPLGPRHGAGGSRAGFRRLVEAVNRRDLGALDLALEDYMGIERDPDVDFLASLYAVRASQAALGEATGWRERDEGIARRCLHRVLALRAANPALPGVDVPESTSAWAQKRLERL